MINKRWMRNINVGDCKTCLCRISPQKSGPETDGDKNEAVSQKGELSDSQMSSQLLASLKMLRDDESLCDVILCTESTTSTKISAHKIVLAAASPYFRKMFSCGLKEAQNGRVVFHDILPEVLAAVVNFIYTGKIQIDESTVDGLLDAADLFQLPSLRNLCLWWLTTNLNPSNCLGTYVLASLRLHLDLAQTALIFSINRFREVIESEEFLHLSPEHLTTFLNSPFLGCDNDGQLIKALLEWTSHDEKRRVACLLPLLERVNLSEILPQVLIEVIQHPVVMSAPPIEKLIRDTLAHVLSRKFDALEPHDEIASSSTASLMNSNFLRCFYQQDVIFAVGGESQGQSLSNVECFMMGYDGWKCSIPLPLPTNVSESSEMTVIPRMKQCRFYPATASDKYSLYVIGGQDCGFPLNIVEKYNILENRWRTLSPIPISLHGCGAAMVNSRLYLAGGRSSQINEKRVWIYDEKEDSWNEINGMKTHRAHLAVCSSLGELYAIGGIGGVKVSDNAFLSSVEKFDPITNTWTTLAPMHEERAFHSVAVVECNIYVMGGCNGKNWLRTVEKFDIMNGQWSKVCNMSIPRSSFGTTVTSGRIYCVGGFDGVHFLNTVEKYNPRTDRWHCVHAMQIERYGLIVATLSIPLKSSVSTVDYS